MSTATDIDAILADIKAAARGRTRYEGQTPRRDEVLAAEIERLRAENKCLRATLLLEWTPSDADRP
jgi:hypothetical protein